MWRCVALCVSLFAFAGSGRVDADDEAKELARLAGQYTAESSVRTGQLPAKAEVLKTLTLEINKDGWVQNFRGEIAPYRITLDLTNNQKAMQLIHQKVRAVRNCTYVLKGDSLTVTEQVGQDGNTAVTVWKRKPIK